MPCRSLSHTWRRLSAGRQPIVHNADSRKIAEGMHSCLNDWPNRLPKMVLGLSAIVCLAGGAVEAVAAPSAPVALGQSSEVVGASLPAGWVSSWSMAAQQVPPPQFAPSFNRAPATSNRTVRQIVYPSSGGARLRIRLTNRFGMAPLELRSISVALAGRGAEVMTGSAQSVTFGGRANIVIPAGLRNMERPPSRCRLSRDSRWRSVSWPRLNWQRPGTRWRARSVMFPSREISRPTRTACRSGRT